MENARGAYVVAVTPFAEDGSVDLASIDMMVDFYLGRGVNGFTVLGVSGEAARLTHAESVAVAKQFIRRASGRPVVVGVTNRNVAQLAALARETMDLGAAGVMVSPSGGQRTEEDVLAHFDSVFGAIGEVPTMLQDYPVASGVAMSVATIGRIVTQFPQIKALKHEDMPGLAKLTALRRNLARRIAILCGNNGLFLPFELRRGADGTMLGFSFPEMLVELCRLYAAERFDDGANLYDRYLPLLLYESQGFWGIAVRKEVLRRRGALRCARLRPPGPVLGEADLMELDALLCRLAPSIGAVGAR